MYSFEVEDPEITLNDVTESALRGVVGTSSLELLIGERREQIPVRTLAEVQETLDNYGDGAGITVTSINLNVVDYPKSVQEAVDDTQKARNDRDFFKLEATLMPMTSFRARGVPRNVFCRMPKPTTTRLSPRRKVRRRASSRCWSNIKRRRE